MKNSVSLGSSACAYFVTEVNSIAKLSRTFVNTAKPSLNFYPNDLVHFEWYH